MGSACTREPTAVVGSTGSPELDTSAGNDTTNTRVPRKYRSWFPEVLPPAVPAPQHAVTVVGGFEAADAEKRRQRRSRQKGECVRGTTESAAGTPPSHATSGTSDFANGSVTDSSNPLSFGSVSPSCGAVDSTELSLAAVSATAPRRNLPSAPAKDADDAITWSYPIDELLNPIPPPMTASTSNDRSVRFC